MKSTGEIVFEDGSIVYFKGIEGCLWKNVLFFDKYGKEVQYAKILGKRYRFIIYFNHPNKRLSKKELEDAMQDYQEAWRRYELFHNERLRSCMNQWELVFPDGKVFMVEGLPGGGWENTRYFDEQGQEIPYKEIERKYHRYEFLSLIEDGHRRFMFGDMLSWLIHAPDSIDEKVRLNNDTRT